MINLTWSFNDAFQAHEACFLDCCLQVAIVLKTVDNSPDQRDWLITIHNHRQQRSFVYRGILWDARLTAVEATMELQAPTRLAEC